MSRVKALCIFRWKDGRQNQTPFHLASAFQQNSYDQANYMYTCRQYAAYQSPDTKQVYQQDGVQWFVWTTVDQVSGVAVTDQQYPQEGGWVLLNKLLMDFKDYYKASPGDYENVYQDMDERSLPYPNIRDWFNKGQNPADVHALQGIKATLDEVQFKNTEALHNQQRAGENIEEFRRRTEATLEHAEQARKKSIEAKNKAISENQTCCMCIPQKQGFTGLSYGYVVSLGILIILDLVELTDSIFMGIITIAIHLPYLYVAPGFVMLKKRDYNFPSYQEEPNIEFITMRMKIGGILCCVSAVVGVLFSWYFIWQCLIGAGYIYLVFVRYKNAGVDGDDDYKKQYEADTEAAKGKMTQLGAKAMQKIHTPKGYDNY